MSKFLKPITYGSIIMLLGIGTALANGPGEKKGHVTQHGYYHDPLQDDHHFKNRYGYKGKKDHRVPSSRKIREVDVQVDKRNKMLVNNTMLNAYIKKILDMPREDYKMLEHYVLLIKKIPGIKVDYELRPVGKNQDDVIIRIRRERGMVGVGVDNHGDKDLGRHQFSLFAEWLNPYGFNDAIIASLGTSDNMDKIFLGTVGYKKRLNTLGTSLKMLASYLQTDPFKFDQKDNTTVIYRGQLEHYFYLTNDNSLKLLAGLEYRDTREQDATVRRKSLSYDYTTGFIGAVVKHNDMLKAENWFNVDFIGTVDEASVKRYSDTVENFDKNFMLFKANWFRDQPLVPFQGGEFSFFSQLTYINSNDKMPIEHQFAFGNATTGKGYKTGLLSANEAFAPNVELRYTYGFNNNDFVEVVQPYAFVEGAHYTKTRTYVDKKELYSWGGGVRLYTPFDMRADIDVALPYTKNVKVDGINRKNNTNVTFMLSKEFKF